MNEEQKREVAVFRFGVIHDLVGGMHLWEWGTSYSPPVKGKLITEWAPVKTMG